MEKETKQPTYKTQPLSTIERKLQEKFAEEIANQGALMDSMGKQLLSLELAMVGIYARRCCCGHYLFVVVYGCGGYRVGDISRKI